MFLASLFGIFEHVPGKLRHVHDKFGNVLEPVLEMFFGKVGEGKTFGEGVDFGLKFGKKSMHDSQ